MSRVKVPEFKVGETVSADTFNNAFDQFKRENLVLDGDNFADQAFGFDQVPSGISLTDRTNFTESFYTFTSKNIEPNTRPSNDPWRSPYSSFSGIRETSINHPNNNIIQLQNLEHGEQFIIRASCVIDTVDGGWRTFMFGIPPVVKIGLVRFDGQTSADFGGSTTNANTFPIKETLAHYRIAFTSKVPSASSLSLAASKGSYSTGDPLEDISWRERGQTTLHTHRDTRKNNLDDEYGTVRENPYMPFDGFHSYSTCFLYTHNASSSSATQSFGVMCSEIGGKVGYTPSGGGSGSTIDGGKYGCKDPEHQSFTIRNFSLFAYQVKK